MPFADNEGVRIYWRERGAGEPLLLIMGYGYPSEMWHHVEPGLAAGCRVLLFDNRGIGRSGRPSDPYLMTAMAGDAAAVLDAAGVQKAHVFGVSMGGYIAQELALQQPRRIRSLVLGGTMCGGSHAVAADQEVLDAFEARKSMPPEQGVRALVPYIYDRKTPAERIEADLVIRLRDYPTPETSAAQLAGVLQWESYDRLAELRVPTLVIHGAHDRLIPPENGRLLAEKIAGARFVMLADASHLFFTDRPGATVSAVLEFLSGQSSGQGE